MWQAALAFAAAPFIGMLVSAPVVATVFGDGAAWGLYFGFGLLVAYPTALMLGVPIYLLMRWRSVRVTPTRAVLGGLGAALGGFAALHYPFSGPYFEQAGPLTFTLAISVGATAGFAFWLILEKCPPAPRAARVHPPAAIVGPQARGD